jgi:3-deoxy-D-manno-octulosonic-acid transferase
MFGRFFLCLYNTLWYLVAPGLPLYLQYKARRNPAYLDHQQERFGVLEHDFSQPVVIVHAVSVGETRALEPLLRLLIQQYPHYQWILTHGTPTGRATGKQLYTDLPLLQTYLPYDHPRWIKRWLNHLNPKAVIIMETEIWPNLLFSLQARHIPSFLVNARLSDQSASRYRWIRSALPPITQILAQSSRDAHAFSSLGYKQVVVCGNTKFDVPLPPCSKIQAFNHHMPKNRPIVVVGSTREGEEALILKAWKKNPPNALLIIVPRHPERFEGVESLLRSMHMDYIKRSEGFPFPNTAVWLGDSMGELLSYYYLADAVLMGGSLQDLGSHSFIEPLQLGKPTYVGPSVFNFQHWFWLAYEAGVLKQVSCAEHWIKDLHRILSINPQERRQWSHQIAGWLNQQLGASKRIADCLASSLQ